MRRRNVIGPQQDNTQRWKSCTQTAHTGERLCSRLTTVETVEHQREHATISNQPWQPSPSRLPSLTPMVGSSLLGALLWFVINSGWSQTLRRYKPKPEPLLFQDFHQSTCQPSKRRKSRNQKMFIQNISFLNLLKKLWSNDDCEVVRTSAVNQPFEISTFISKRLIVCSGKSCATYLMKKVF